MDIIYVQIRSQMVDTYVTPRDDDLHISQSNLKRSASILKHHRQSEPNLNPGPKAERGVVFHKEA